MQRSILGLAVLTTLWFALVTAAWADNTVFVRTGKASFKGPGSKDVTRFRLMATTRRQVLEDVARFMASLPVIKGTGLSRGDILGMATGLVTPQILWQRDYATSEAFGTFVKAKAALDRERLESAMGRLIRDPTVLEKYGEIQAREALLLKRLDALEGRNWGGTGKGATLATAFDALKRSFRALEWNRKAVGLWRGGICRDPVKALTYLNQSIRLDPGDAASLHSRGQVLARKGYPELAITEFTKALGLMSRYPAPYAHRGDVWLEKGLWKRAASDYAAALNLNPSYAAALNGMARLLTLCPDPDVRDPEKAVVFARKAVAVFPRAAHLRTLARAYEAMGNRKAATDARERAAKQEQEAEYTFTLREVSDLLGCSRRLLGRMIRSGGLKAARVGNDYRISRADLEAFWRARGGGRLLSEDVR